MDTAVFLGLFNKKVGPDILASGPIVSAKPSLRQQIDSRLGI